MESSIESSIEESVAYNANECLFVSYKRETYTKQFRLNFVPLTNTLTLMKSIASAIRSHYGSSAFKFGLWTHGRCVCEGRWLHSV